jgi:hypothetical protein
MNKDESSGELYQMLTTFAVSMKDHWCNHVDGWLIKSKFIQFIMPFEDSTVCDLPKNGFLHLYSNDVLSEFISIVILMNTANYSLDRLSGVKEPNLKLKAKLVSQDEGRE